MLAYERQYWDAGVRLVVGIDEAGRGPLAGPVVAAAVWMDPSLALAEEHGMLEGLTDSKKLSAARRQTYLALLMQGHPRIRAGIGISSAAEIDRINILRATHLAMARAVESLDFEPAVALVDGLPVQGLPCEMRAIVRGDQQSLLIAAASVLAKEVRDAWMIRLNDRYPAYGFASHKGYGSSRHVQALLEFGACPEHRRSFRPVREAESIRSHAAPTFGFMSETDGGDTR